VRARCPDVTVGVGEVKMEAERDKSKTKKATEQASRADSDTESSNITTLQYNQANPILSGLHLITR